MQVALTKEFNRKLVGIRKEADRRAINSSVEKFYDNPSNPGLNLEPLAAKSDLYSVRVNSDMRIILYKAPEAWTMLHVDYHDAAYRWAERAKVERHPRTRVVQLVHTEEVYQERVFEHPAQYQAEPPLFEEHKEDYLLSLGVPENALPTLQGVTSEDDLEKMAELLPEGVWERLLDLYCGETVDPPAPASQDQSPLEPPEAQRQFFIVEDGGSSAGPWSCLGRSGWFSCTRYSVRPPEKTSGVRPRSLAPPAPARLSSRSTGPGTSLKRVNASS